GDFALRLGRDVVHVAGVGNGLFDRRLCDSGVQVHQVLHVLDGQKSLGVGNAVLECRLGGIEGQGRQTLERGELGVGETDEGLNACFVACYNLLGCDIHFSLSLEWTSGLGSVVYFKNLVAEYCTATISILRLKWVKSREIYCDAT